LQLDQLFPSNGWEIVDLTEVEELDLQGDESLKLADENPFSADAKRAFAVETQFRTMRPACTRFCAR
jgi:hypothetical protein